MSKPEIRIPLAVTEYNICKSEELLNSMSAIIPNNVRLQPSVTVTSVQNRNTKKQSRGKGRERERGVTGGVSKSPTLSLITVLGPGVTS